MAAVITDTSKLLRAGDNVIVRGNGAPGVITKMMHDKAQIDGKRWHKLTEITPVYAGFQELPDRKNKPRLQAAEYIEILKNIGYTFSMSELDNRLHSNEIPIDDMHAATIRAKMRDLGHISVRVIEDAYAADALINSFHPVRDFLNGLEWDGEERIGKVAQFFTDRDNVFFLFFRHWMIGAVAKAFTGAQNPMLVLDGKQDAGKSFFVRWLCSPLPKMHVEGPIRPDNKDDQIRLITSWIWEVAELGSTTRRSDREALKHFLTVEQVKVRAPYGHFDMIKPALASFIGTVNGEGGSLLDDPTGTRRFVVVELERIDWNYRSIDVVQMWAEAKAAYDAGEKWQLQDDERELSRAINERYKVQNPIDDLLTQLFEMNPENPEWVTPTNKILEVLHTAGWKLHTPRSESMALASALKKTPVIKPDNKIVDPVSGQQVRGYIGIRQRVTTTW